MGLVEEKMRTDLKQQRLIRTLGLHQVNQRFGLNQLGLRNRVCTARTGQWSELRRALHDADSERKSQCDQSYVLGQSRDESEFHEFPPQLS
jgi:hypothetical protein